MYLNLLTTFSKRFILDVWVSSEFFSALLHIPNSSSSLLHFFCSALLKLSTKLEARKSKIICYKRNKFDKIVLSKKKKMTKNSQKNLSYIYYTGYDDNDKIVPLLIELPQLVG